MRRIVALGSGCVVLLLSGSAAPAKKEPAPKLPPPSVELRIEPRPMHAWVMTVTNTGDVPLKLVADARLLRLEIEPPPGEPVEEKPSKTAKGKAKKKTAAKTVECVLPASMRSDARTLVLQPGSRYLEQFDPRLFCLDASKHLAAGAKVTAHLGWSAGKGKTLAAPFVVTAATPSAAKEIASAKEIVASAVEVGEKSAIVPKTAALAPTTKMPLLAHSGAAHSLLHGKDASETIVIVNASSEPQRVYARPQLVGARVRSPKGVVTSCEPWARPAPIVDFVVRLKPEAKWTASVELNGLCPDGTFDVPGLYEIVPRLHADPIPWEPSAVAGEIVADTPQLLRIEEGEKPFHDLPPFSLDTSE